MTEQHGQPRLYACFEGEMFVFCFKEQRLQYANTFLADVAGNAAYYLLSAWKGWNSTHRPRPGPAGTKQPEGRNGRLPAKFVRNVKNASATVIFKAPRWHATRESLLRFAMPLANVV